MAIKNLPTVTTLSAADLVALFSASGGIDASATLQTLLEWLQDELTAANDIASQYSSPSAAGFNVTVAPLVAGGNVFLLLTPLAGYATGTVTLPDVAAAAHGQEVVVHCTQTVTTLTVAGNGATSVSGAPTTLSAGSFFRLRFDGVQKSWYRIG